MAREGQPKDMGLGFNQDGNPIIPGYKDSLRLDAAAARAEAGEEHDVVDGENQKGLEGLSVADMLFQTVTVSKKMDPSVEGGHSWLKDAMVIGASADNVHLLYLDGSGTISVPRNGSKKRTVVFRATRELTKDSALTAYESDNVLPQLGDKATRDKLLKFIKERNMIPGATVNIKAEDGAATNLSFKSFTYLTSNASVFTPHIELEGSDGTVVRVDMRENIEVKKTETGFDVELPPQVQLQSLVQSK